MFKTLFTRKNLIAISLVILYSFVLLFTGICLDGGSSMVSKRNPIALLGQRLGIKTIDPGTTGFLCLILVAVYVIVFAVAFIYERRYAIVNHINPRGAKMIWSYVLTLLACLVLSLGIGVVIQKPLTAENIGNLFTYLGQSLVISLCIYALLFAIAGAVLMFIVNFIFIDKPYKFFDGEEQPIFDDEDIIESNDVAGSFGEGNEDSAAGTANGNGGAGGAGGNGGTGYGDNFGDSVIRTATELDDREKVFPALSRVDNEYEGFVNDYIESDELSLKEICTRFRNYLAKHEQLYFEIDTIRFFLSGFAASHFEILEGLSGTGKSSLPRYFAKFINGRVLFMPVQATWRDRSNVFGFFNEFSKTYNETEFLVELYRANYNPDVIHMFVLDEMNISRVEYYFADLLSVLEYPEDEWKLKLMQVPYDFVPPVKLEDGAIQIPTNSYFVGTANKDDSTFTITDKVYDRAITTEFDYKNDAFEVEGEAGTIRLGNSRLRALYEQAMANDENKLNAADYKKFNTICEFVYDQFDIAIGNRILTQVDNIVPVFVACGGTKEAAIDYMLSKKLIGKIEGRFEEYVKGALNQLQELIDKTYGPNVLKRTERTIRSILRTL